MHKLGTQNGWSMNDQGSVHFPHSMLDQLPLCAQAGITALRFGFRVGGGYPDWTTPDSSGFTALDKYDEVVYGCQKAGIELLGLLSPESLRSSQSRWCANTAEHDNATGDNLELHAFAKALVLLAQRYPSITQWEVWNEPNVWTTSPAVGVYSGGSYMYPSNFAWLLTNCAKAVQDAGLPIRLISGGITSFDWGSGLDYLKATAECGKRYCGWQAGMPVQGLGQHLYIVQGKQVTRQQIQAPLLDLHQQYHSLFGVAAPPTLITEIGWQQPYVSPNIQAANLQNSVLACQQLGFIESIYWFCIQDNGTLLFGLFDSTGAPKPTFAAWKGLSVFPPSYSGNVKVSLDTYWNTLQLTLPKDGEYATVFQEWVTQRLVHNIDFGPPLRGFQDMGDWGNTPIKCLICTNGRAEYTPSTNTCRWWLAEREVSL